MAKPSGLQHLASNIWPPTSDHLGSSARDNYISPDTQPQKELVDLAWHYVCESSDIPLDGGREFVVKARIVALFRSAQRIHAIDGMCAHQGGPIAQGQLDGDCVTCPWHGWQYDITDGRNLLTGQQMLDCFPVELRSTAVWINVE